MNDESEKPRSGAAELGGAAVRLGVSLLSTKLKLILLAVIAAIAIIALVAGAALIGVLSMGDSDQTATSAGADGTCLPATSSVNADTVSISGADMKSPVDSLPDSAMPTAAIIVATAREEGFSDQAAILAITTSIGESGLGTNPDSKTPNGDGDAGPFQQRQYDGWYGSLEQVNDPAYATRAFLQGVTAESPGDYGSVGGGSGYGHIPGLKDIEGWEGMAPAEAIHSVQKNDPDTNFVYSNNYENAKLIFQAVSGVDPASIENVGAVNGTPSANCAPGSAGPIEATGDAGAVIEAAKSQLGHPYVFGGGNGDGPSASNTEAIDAGEVGYDCSGITSYAFKQGAGIDLRRVASDQWADYRANQVSEDDLQPGDLLFYTYGRKGSVVSHVAIYIGNGEMIEASRGKNEVVITTARTSQNDSAFTGAARVLTGDAPQTGGDAK